ncbi:MAG: type II secretion system protein [Candidatus Gracilibacteria bacterium]|nr:type II secretion system protein [Candidatus Gracilibacteria bacterium]
MKTINFPHRASPLEAQEQRISPLSRGRLREVLGFTLIELIVVITILAILGTIAFINLQGFAGSARDSARVSDLANITQGLELSLVKNGSIPPPEAPTGGGVITLTASGGTLIGYQGVVGANTLSIIKMSNAQDPLDKKYYTYITNASSSSYQLLALFEDASTATTLANPLITPVYAGYEARIPTTKGYALGALLATSGAYLNQPLQEIVTTATTLDIQNFSGTLAGMNIGNITTYFSKTDTISGTGNIISTPLQISMNNGGNGFNTPGTCPTGFIAVPGNKDFNQPGFCVSKYDMTYSDADIPNSSNGDWNTVSYVSGKPIASIPNKYPIADITQPQAITACQSMGAGYHLITNNEWMTVARNIEQQGDNWSTGIVGSGGLYRGITGEGTNTPTSLGCNTADSAGASGISGRIWATKPLSTDTTKFGATKTTDCDSKRQLKLSNGQILWDMAGNIWSHVNKGNTLDGNNFNLG